jgi:hypothetical protein
MGSSGCTPAAFSASAISLGLSIWCVWRRTIRRRFKVSPPCQRPLVPETAPERGQSRHHRQLSRELGDFHCHLAPPAHLRWLYHSGEPGRRFPGRCRDLRSARPAGRSPSDSFPRSKLEIQKLRFHGRRFFFALWEPLAVFFFLVLISICFAAFAPVSAELVAFGKPPNEATVRRIALNVTAVTLPPLRGFQDKFFYWLRSHGPFENLGVFELWSPASF